jgi:hypothetical protein
VASQVLLPPALLQLRAAGAVRAHLPGAWLSLRTREAGLARQRGRLRGVSTQPRLSLPRPQCRRQ